MGTRPWLRRRRGGGVGWGGGGGGALDRRRLANKGEDRGGKAVYLSSRRLPESHPRHPIRWNGTMCGGFRNYRTTRTAFQNKSNRFKENKLRKSGEERGGGPPFGGSTTIVQGIKESSGMGVCVPVRPRQKIWPLRPKGPWRTV